MVVNLALQPRQTFEESSEAHGGTSKPSDVSNFSFSSSSSLFGVVRDPLEVEETREGEDDPLPTLRLPADADDAKNGVGMPWGRWAELEEWFRLEPGVASATPSGVVPPPAEVLSPFSDFSEPPLEFVDCDAVR